jgi:two-component system, OmpR family, response regulator
MTHHASLHDGICKKVIIVEDDDDLRESMKEYLLLDGYDVTAVSKAISLYKEIASQHYTLAILDLTLPDQDGLVIAQYLRSNTAIRILMLTSRTSDEERLAGFESGADLYMVKPVKFPELSASIANLLDRFHCEKSLIKSGSGNTKEQWSLLQCDWMLVSPQGQSVKLTCNEFTFLYCLALESPQTVSRQKLLTALEYQKNSYGNRSLESLVNRLRKKIAHMETAPLKTSHGKGYNFTYPLNVV